MSRRGLQQGEFWLQERAGHARHQTVGKRNAEGVQEYQAVREHSWETDVAGTRGQMIRSISRFPFLKPSCKDKAIPPLPPNLQVLPESQEARRAAGTSTENSGIPVPMCFLSPRKKEPGTTTS